MKRTTLSLIVVTAMVASATLAQERSPERKKCTTTTTYVHGLQDNFSGGPEPTTPSPALAAMLSTLNAGQYDYEKPNHAFGDSFQICGCKTCGGTLEVRVRKTNPEDIPTNDGIAVGIAPFNGPRVVSALVWVPGDPPVKTLTFNLDPGKLNEVLCAQKTATPWLDVYVQDDTVVDYIKLTILHP